MITAQDNLGSLIGKTLVRAVAGSDELTFVDTEGTKYLFNHSQNCCERVYIEMLEGDLADLVGSPILMAESVRDAPNPHAEDSDAYKAVPHNDCEMWTFYKFATVKGYVDVRWFGSSNGYYAVNVDLTVTRKKDN